MQETLGHYRILDKLGAGGMGEVYVAEDTRLKRRVALKLLPAEMSDDHTSRERLRLEAEAVAALDHPNIVAVHSLEEAAIDGDGPATVHFFTMQWIDGQTLSKLIPEQGLDRDTLLDLALPLTDALAAAHRRNIVHRDLKPANIMVGTDSRLRVLDFGLAKSSAGPLIEPSTEGKTATQLTTPGMVVGTVPYMAPEQLRGEALDPRTDVFALGTILYEMALGRKPFDGDSAIDLVTAILRDTPEPVSKRKNSLPPELDRIISRCLEKDPADRYESAAQLFADLQALRRESLGPISSPNAASVAKPLPVRPSLAIRPFRNLSDDPEQDDLAFGLWVDLNADLVKLPGLFLISQTSTGSYAGKSVEPAEVAAELGVRYILDGTVRRSGKRVRIAVQLADTQTGTTRWAERYDGEMGDLFALQDEITAKVLSALEVQLVHGESHKDLQRALRDPRAQQVYYKALAAMFTFRPEGFVDARQLLLEVQDLEPDTPVAHVFTSFAHFFEAKLGYSSSPEESMRLAMEAGARAIELGDTTGFAHMIQGMLHLNSRHHEQAQTASDYAVRDRPNCPWAHALRGAIYNYSGRPARAVDLAQLAIRYTPLTPPIFSSLLATGLFHCGQFDAAIDAARGTLALEGDNLEARVILAGALAANGEGAQAGAECDQIRRQKPDFSLSEFLENQPYKDPTQLDGLVGHLRAAGLG